MLILVRFLKGDWRIVSVKSTYKVKPYFPKLQAKWRKKFCSKFGKERSLLIVH